LGPLGTATTNAPAPGVYDDGEIGGMMNGKGTEVLGENLPQCRFVHRKRHMLSPDANPGRRAGKPATNHLNYGTALETYPKIKCTGLVDILVLHSAFVHVM
jgi:hypothetical protein